MKKKLSIIIMVIFITAVSFAGSGRTQLLRDGLGLSGVDGKIVAGENDRWFFKLDSDLSDDKGFVKAETLIEMMPSSALETVVADPGQKLHAGFRIWGRVTRYESRNYIFAIYFLPIVEVKKSVTSRSRREEKAEIVNDPNDALTVPAELVEKLSTRRIIKTEDLKKGLQLKQDSILADRTGFITERNGQPFFVIDGMGRNIPKVSIRLLPCYFLEIAEKKQNDSLEQQRFKVAGIVTRYKDENYLLLQRARRVYSHGNFPK